MRPTRNGATGWLVIAILTAGSVALGDTPEPRPRIFALTGATVLAAPGRTLENATVVLRDGLVEAVGADVTIPSDAVEIDLSGRWVFPGLIDAGGALSAAPKAEDGPRARGRASGASHPIAKVRPEHMARDHLEPFTGDREKTAERYRKLGITVMLVDPGPGVFRGRSAAVALVDGRPVSEILLSGDVAQHIAFERGRFGDGYPTSLMGSVAAVRQAFLDAERHAVWLERWESDPLGLTRPDAVAAYDALVPLLRGPGRAIFVAESPDDVLLADTIATEFGLEATIESPGTVWEIADEVAAAGRTVIVPVAFPDRPGLDPEEVLDTSTRDLRRFVEAPAGPARLQDAGVRFALTTRGLDNPADFRRNMARMIEAGLSEDAALAAWTTVPAGILGLDRAVGTLDPGKIANLVVSDGPPFAEDTKAERVFVDGVEYRIEQRRGPQGDPNAEVDPRGEWSVVFTFSRGKIARSWTIEGQADAWSGTAETGEGTVSFDRVELVGNMLTVVYPARGDRPASEITVVITGDTFEGVAEFGRGDVELRGTRTTGPDGAEGRNRR